MQPDFATLKPVGPLTPVGAQPDFSTLKLVTPTTPEGTTPENQDILGPTEAKGFIPSLLQNTVGSRGIAGVGMLPAKIGAALSEYGPGGKYQAEDLYATAQRQGDQALALIKQAETEADPVRKVNLMKTGKDMLAQARQTISAADNIKQNTDTTGGQALGTTLNAGLTVATAGESSLLGEVSPLFKPLATGTSDINAGYKVLRVGGKVAENALLGVGFNTANNLENQQTITEGDGTAALLGATLPLAGEGASFVKNAAQKATGVTAERLIGGLIKPLGKDFAYGKDPIRGILNEGITANSIDDLAQKVAQKRQSIGQRIGEIGDELTTRQTQATDTLGKTPGEGLPQLGGAASARLPQTGREGVQVGKALDLTPALKPIDSAMERAARLNNQTLVNSLYDVKVALTHDLGLATDSATGRPIIQTGVEKDIANLDYSQAVKFLSDISDHTRFTGNPSDDKMLNAATKQAYGAAREIMNTKASEIDPKLGAEIKDLNSRYADLSSAKVAINHRELAIKRANYISLAGRVGFGLTTAGALASGLLSGDWSKAGAIFIAGLGELGASKLADSPATITRIAKFLNGLGQTERQGVIEATPVLKNYWDRFFHGGGTSDYSVQSTGITKVPVQQADTLERTVPMTKTQKLALPEGSIKLPEKGVLEGQAKLR